MQIDFFGANCIRIKTKQGTVVFDDNLAALGSKSITADEDIALSTNESTIGLPQKYRLPLTLPGEYEVGDIMISGIPAQSHIDEKGTVNAVIYRGQASDIKFAVLGHIAADLSEEQLESIGVIDILFIPTGGNGYTLDATAAAKIVKQISPKLVIPTHYDQKGITYEMPQNDYSELATILSVDPVMVGSSSLKVKRSDLAETMELKVLG